MRKADKNKPVERHFTAFPILTDVSLFEESEGTFSDFGRRQRVYVHLVPAPWPRVIMLSLVYALAVNFVKVLWFEFVGVPQWHLVASGEVGSGEVDKLPTPSPDPAPPKALHPRSGTTEPSLFNIPTEKLNVADRRVENS